MKLMIVAGFLGAGKTTWIRRFLQKQKQLRSICVIENDFGPINVDAQLIGKHGISVRSLDSGCICCSISGDFVEALHEIQRELAPELVIVEPSGVARLSQLEQALSSRGDIAPEDVFSVTVVDASTWCRNLENNGDYFEDQLRSARALCWNRLDRIEQPLEMFLDEFPQAHIYSEEELLTLLADYSRGWPELSADTPHVTAGRKPGDTVTEHPEGASYAHGHENGHCCGHEHHHEHEDGHCCGHEHDHEAEPLFQSVLTLAPVLSLAAWQRCFSEERAAQLVRKSIFRVKGFVATEEGQTVFLQWAGGELDWETGTDAPEELIGRLIWIGRSIDAGWAEAFVNEARL